MVAEIGIRFGLPAGSKVFGDLLPGPFLDRRIVRTDPSDESSRLIRLERFHVLLESLKRLASQGSTVIRLLKTVMVHDSFSQLGMERMVGEEPHDLGERIEPTLVEPVGVEVVALAQRLAMWPIGFAWRCDRATCPACALGQPTSDRLVGLVDSIALQEALRNR